MSDEQREKRGVQGSEKKGTERRIGQKDRKPDGKRQTKKERLDVRLVEEGLAPSREAAQRVILAGRVTADGRREDKAGRRVSAEAELAVAGPASRFVSRGGEKLDAALSRFGIDVAGRCAADIGASTGGFTDCLLQRGARRVYAVDVGRGQLHDKLRRDPRVTVMTGVNARAMDPGLFPEMPEIAAVDVSFISLRKILPAVAGCLAPGGTIVALIKPQFEGERRDVGRGGLVREAAKRRRIVDALLAWTADQGWGRRDLAPSVLAGTKGNQEYFAWINPEGADDPERIAAALVVIAGEGPK